MPVLTTAAALQRTNEANGNRAFMRIVDYVPGVLPDTRPATTPNVFYTKPYNRPTPFDAPVYAPHPHFKGLPEPVLKNRQLLIGVMGRPGFPAGPVECRHFNCVNGLNHELLDVAPAGMNEIIRKPSWKASLRAGLKLQKRIILVIIGNYAFCSLSSDMKQGCLFYALYPFIYILASLPFSLLYKVSDFFYFLLKSSGYRRAVVLKNLKNSFPEKSDAEIASIAENYYRYLSDLILETLKTLKMTKQEALERCHFKNTAWLEKLYEDKKSILVVMGHYGNWEWAGPAFTLSTNFQLNVVYRPLSNRYFERMMTGMRTKFGTRITPVQLTLRQMVATRNEITATALVADQTASPENAYWTTFLNQDTAVYVGPEKLAKKFNYPVVYMNAKRVRRGYYEVTPELLFADPTRAADGEICEAFIKRLEQEITHDPITWLWSHRRWKHVRAS